MEDNEQTARQDQKQLFARNSRGQRFWRFALLWPGRTFMSIRTVDEPNLIFSDESAALVRRGFQHAELDVFLLHPECDKIADL